MKKIGLILIGALALAACGSASTITQGFKEATAVEDDLKTGLGAKAIVGFKWRGGLLTEVTVFFSETPKDKSLQEIEAAAKAAIAKEFKQTPETIVVSFTFAP
jgi:ABC-type glycerol-3-phosphate transport system substrate-binding protein